MALYLLAHGLVKGFVVAALLKDKLWDYPAAIVVLGGFFYRKTSSSART